MFGAKIMRRAALETEIISESMKDFSLISNEITTTKNYQLGFLLTNIFHYLSYVKSSTVQL